MIIGIGVDSIAISRVQKAMEKRCFADKIFTSKERQQMDKKYRRAASDFAGKEAVVKVFGTGFNGVDANEISILRNDKGAPYIELYGKAKEKEKEMNIDEWHISLTNTEDVVTAFVIGSRRK